jgi:hypothetical protein
VLPRTYSFDRDRAYGRGGGVGRALGNGLERGDSVGLGVGVGVGVVLGVAVGIAVGVAVGAVAVGVGVRVDLGVAVAVGVGVDVGPCTSNEPMSIRPFTTRLNPGPRWSNKGGGVKFGSPASIAGLQGNNACVKVRAAVVLQRTQHWIGVDLVAPRSPLRTTVTRLMRSQAPAASPVANCW